MILPGLQLDAVERAARHLAQGALVAFPTETVYGLGARADDDAAVARIFHAKGRPSDHPLIVHVADAAAAQHFAASWPADTAQRLAQAFWPGPLTLIVARRPDVGAAAAGGQNSIGLRCPAHPVAQALLQAAQGQGVWGVAAPSANRFGRISPTTAAHVATEFDDELWVLDGGPCAVGIESTIIDCTRPQPVLLRPGVLLRAQIEAVLEQTLGEPGIGAPRASGTLAAHYAPRAPLRLMGGEALSTALQVLGASPLKLAVYAHSVKRVPSGVLLRRMPTDATAAAQELFAVLRELDDRAVQLIWVETPPAGPEWEGVRDRLQRAAAA
ncbi:MAG: L-threonylcarbamoyladenylate synthase [Pseudomonadota bacterium]